MAETAPPREPGPAGDAAGKRLHECEQALREVQRLACIGSWRRTLPDGNIWWSDELYRIFGVDPASEPLSLELLFSRIHTDDRERFKAQVAALDPHRGDYRIVVPGGAVRHIHEEVSLERDEHGTPVRFYGTAQDITERMEVMEALRKSEQLLQAVFDAEPECVKLLDESAKLILMNRAGLDMLEVDSLDQIKGQCVCPLVTSEYRQPFLELTKRIFRGESGTLLFEMIGMKGRRLWLETHAVPLRNGRGEITALLGVTRDVTEAKRTEEALRSSEARFRAITEGAPVGILVADIASAAFLYANPEICHLLGYTEQELLALTVTDLVAQEERAESAAGFQGHASGKLHATERTFRRKDGSPLRMSINSVPIELDGRPRLVTYELSLSDDLQPIEADAGQIGQVIQNIVLNAEQSMPLGGRIEISARNVPASRAPGLSSPPADGLVEISVRDQGMGIPPEHLQRVRSDLGKGSTFTIWLPASLAARERPAVAAEQPAAWKGRVLVMDDEEMIRTVAGELLHALGHEAVFTADGVAAIERYAAAQAAGKPFDVVILDLTVRGGMGGAETVRRLLEINPAAKVVVSSGYSDSEAVAHFREHGFRAFLNKPYNLEALSKALDDARAS